MSGPSRTPSRTPSYASIGANATTESSANAALLGATKAFGRPPPKARAVSNNYTGANGALAAATRVGTTPSPKQRTGVASSPVTPGTAGSRHDGMTRTPVLDHNATPSLAVPKQRGRSKSPSHQAAQLAAARSSPDAREEKVTSRARANTTQKPAVAPKPRRLSEHHTRALDSPTDASSIPPTTSLVELFERKSSTPSPSAGMRPGPRNIRPQHDLPMRSPKPLRSGDGGITTVFQMELGESKAVPRAAENIATHDYEPGAREQESSSDEYVSASEDTTAPASSPITIRKRSSRASSGSSLENTSAGPRRPRPSPSPSPLRHSSTHALPVPTKPPSRNFTSPAKIDPPSLSSQSGRSIASQYNMLHPRRMTPLNTGDDLANAIVASSLAARAASPHKTELSPPPIPTRRHHHKLGFSRTPSPTKHVGMRQTMRKEESEESDTAGEDGKGHPFGKHKKKRIVRKHPNKHHEGDRKRWRDAVTERERKRYEGVWAANKGLYCSSQHGESAVAEQQVCGVVTRDIWRRARLPDAILEVVWDLVVDADGNGLEKAELGKEEFVVGMWLIDQRLKGRKLPVKVSGSVWQSVRGLQGIKIRRMG